MLFFCVVGSRFEAWFNVNDLRSDDVDEQIVAEEQKKNVLSMLHQILTPFMLRRIKVRPPFLIEKAAVDCKLDWCVSSQVVETPNT